MKKMFRSALLLLAVAASSLAYAQQSGNGNYVGTPPAVANPSVGLGVSAGPNLQLTSSGVSFDCSKFAIGSTLDVILNTCEAYAITAGGGTADARGLGSTFGAAGGSQTIASHVNQSELIAPTLNAASGGSLTSGAVYKVVYTLNSPAGTSAASEESSNTPSGGNLSFTVSSPTYFGTATTYDVWVTAANGASWTETKCTSSPTAIGTPTTISSVGSCSGGVSSKNNGVTLLLPPMGVWSCTATSGNCLKLFDGSNTQGFNTGLGRGLDISLSAGGSVNSVCGTDLNPKNGASSELTAKGFRCSSTLGGTVTGAAFEDAFTSDLTYIASIEALNTATAGKAYWSYAAGGKRDNIHGDGWLSSGNQGGVPCTLGKSGAAGSTLEYGSLWCPGPGSSQSALVYGGQFNTTIHNFYAENYNTTTCGPWLDLGSVASQSGALLFDLVNQLSNACTNSPQFIQIEAGMTNVSIMGISPGSLTNCINNLANSKTYTCSSLGKNGYHYGSQEVFDSGVNLGAASVLGTPTSLTLTNATGLGTSGVTPNLYAADTGAVNAYVVTLSPAMTAYTTGVTGCFKAANANTVGNPTVNFNGLGAKTIVRFSNNTLSNGDIGTVEPSCVIYDGANFVLQQPQAISGSGSIVLSSGSVPSQAKVSSLSQTAAISTATLCAAGTCAANPGQYHIHLDIWESGTACSSVGSAAVGPSITWTDENGTTHSAVPLPMITNVSGTALATSFIPTVSVLTAWASGDLTISTNGTIIQYATTYTACTTGTLTYNVRATVTRLQ